MTAWAEHDDLVTYCATRLGSAVIDGLADSVLTAALTLAQQQLESCPDFRLPVPRAEVKEGDVVVQQAVEATLPMIAALFEQSLACLIHQADWDARAGLKADGVTSANVIGESYDPAKLNQLPICNSARALLEPYSASRQFWNPVPGDPSVQQAMYQGRTIAGALGWPWWRRTL